MAGMFKRTKKKDRPTKVEPEVEGGVSEEWNIDYYDLEFEGTIGKGNFGKVFKGSYFGTPVAIKRIKEGPSTGLDDELLQKYVSRELSMLKGIHHPNFVQFMGYCVHETGQYLITEYVEGGDLREYILSHSDISWKQRAAIARDIAFAFTFLHKKGLIHRDLKPENLLITETGKIKVCDLGFARTNDKDRYMTIAGSDDYMAPEVLLGDLYDERCDVFGFGIVLGVLVTARKLPARHRADGYAFKPGKLERLLPKDCPPKFASIILQCCQGDPTKRPAFKDILDEFKIIVHELEEEEKKNPSKPVGAKSENPPEPKKVAPPEPVVKEDNLEKVHPAEEQPRKRPHDEEKQIKDVSKTEKPQATPQVPVQAEVTPAAPPAQAEASPPQTQEPAQAPAPAQAPPPVQEPAPAPVAAVPTPTQTIPAPVALPPPTEQPVVAKEPPPVSVPPQTLETELPKKEPPPAEVVRPPLALPPGTCLTASTPAVLPSQTISKEPAPPSKPAEKEKLSSSSSSSQVPAKPSVRRTRPALPAEDTEELAGGFDGSVSVKTRNILLKEAARLKKHGT